MSLLLPSMLKVKKIKQWKDTSLHTAPFFQTPLELFLLVETNPLAQQWGVPIPFSMHSQFGCYPLQYSEHISVEAGIYLFRCTHIICLLLEVITASQELYCPLLY